MSEINDKWLLRTQEAFSDSSTYFDNNIREQVEKDIRQVNGRHPAGSKYFSDAYRGKSKLFRNKTRTAIRQNEAGAAGALFSNEDVVSVRPVNDNDPFQVTSAAINKALLQYRLTKTIPWFLIANGSYQEAMSVGVVCSYQSWLYNEKRGIDEPSIELQPIENIRIASSAKWYDPINTSPYVQRLIPMYAKDVTFRMTNTDTKTGQPKWKLATDRQMQAATKLNDDSIRQTRENRTDSQRNDSSITEFDIVWVIENFMDIDGEDWVYHTLGVEHRLTDPVPLKEVYFHNQRPIVMGICVIEAHKTYPSSVPKLTKDTQAEINEVANGRLDNVKLAMNKRYFVQRNRQVDIRSLNRNISGSVTFMNDVAKDVKVVETNDVTRSAYEEQDRLNLDFDDQAGTFSGSSVQSNRRMNETVGGMEMVSDIGNQMGDYQLRTWVETWVEPVLRQITLLEQAYETDEVILTLAGEKADIKKYGLNEVSDELLAQELTITVNVGIGSTNPRNQVEKFVYAMRQLKDILAEAELLGINKEEVTKEIFGKLGYKDGSRFFIDVENPEVQSLMNTIQELQTALQSKQEDPEIIAAKVDKLRKEADKIYSQAIGEKVNAYKAALEVSDIVASAPDLADLADDIIVEEIEAGAIVPLQEEPGLISGLAEEREPIEQADV
jgi:hypothetical protein